MSKYEIAVRAGSSAAVAWVSLACSGVVLANRNAADTTNALGLQPGGSYGYNLTGAGVTVGVFEAGSAYLVRRTHDEFMRPDGTSRVTTYGSSGVTTSTSYSGHATAVAGTIGASGAGGLAYRGMAPEVSIRSYGSSWFGTYFNSHAASLDLTNHSYSSGTSNAWSTQEWDIPGVGLREYRTWYDTDGSTPIYRNIYTEDPRYGRYNASSRSTDITLHNHPRLLAFYSAGNGRGNQFRNLQGDGKYVARFSSGFTPTNGVSLGNQYWLVSTADYPAPGGGYDSLGGVQTAKNSVIVGSISDYLTDPHTTITANLHSSFSNYGPTDDGRLGVTVMANGESLLTSTSTSNSAYGSYSGTSFSAPNATGTAALLLQHWRNKTGISPMGATQKALLIHTATDMASFSQIGPDYRSGYGLINGLDAAQFIDEASKPDPKTRKAHFFEETITNGQHLTFDFLASGDQQIEASLVWNDPAGTAFYGLDNRNARALVNDLDLWITDASGKIYYPWTLDPNNPGLAAKRTQRNDVDNIENVLLNLNAILTGGLFRVHIGIDGILQGGMQDFSLLVSGGTMVPEPVATTFALIGGAALLRRRRQV